MSDIDSQGSSCGGSEGPRKAGGIIIVNNQWLAIIRGRQSGKWGVPKGSLDESDTSVLAGALREIYEETGLKLKVEKPIDYWVVCKCRLYLFNLSHIKLLQPKDTKEILESKWLDLKNKAEVESVLREGTKMIKGVIKRIRRQLN